MSVRGGVPIAGPRDSDFWQAMLLAGAVLFIGFLAVQVPAVQTLFEMVARFLAVCATLLLRLAGYDMVRNGIEIRDVATGHAVAVTSSCDGNGLIVSVAGAFAWLRCRTSAVRGPIYASGAVVGAILAFNLVRILALFLVIGAPAIMFAEHLYAAPLLSAVLVAFLALHVRDLDAGDVVASPRLWLGIAAAAAIVWYAIGEAATCATAVPLANALLWLLPDELAGTITCGPAHATVATSAVISLDPLRTVAADFYPADFTLAVPLVIASLATTSDPARIARRGLFGLFLFSLAMTLGAITASHDAAIAAAVTLVAGDGTSHAYQPPGQFSFAVLKSVQNVLVHFNLFLLPLVLAVIAGVQPVPPEPIPASAKPKVRRKRARGRR
jgi:hypothetical protein